MLKNLLPFKNIIFDLGGVILDLDFQKTVDEFKKLGITNFQEKYSYFKSDPIFTNLETGKVSAQVFRTEIKKHLPHSVSDKQLDKAWNAMLVDIPKDRVALLGQLNQKFRTFLLSNTNEIHSEYYYNLVKQATGYPNLNHVFEKAYHSNEIGYRKPDPEAFLFVLNKHKLIPEETLFVDDLEPNLEAAKALGMKTFHMVDPNGLIPNFSLLI